MFEPNKRNFETLSKNISDNELRNTKAYRTAVGAESGHELLFGSSNGAIVPKLSLKTMLSRRSLNFIYGASSVPVVSLDAVAEQQSIWPTALKVDVEGFEHKVLQGATQVLKRLPKLLIEIHTEQLALYGSGYQEVFDMLGLKHYDLWLQDDLASEPVAIDYSEFPDLQSRVHLFGKPKNGALQATADCPTYVPKSSHRVCITRISRIGFIALADRLRPA